MSTTDPTRTSNQRAAGTNDLDQLIADYVALSAERAAIDEQLGLIRAHLAGLGAGTHTGARGRVTVTYPHRFSLDRAAEVLPEQLLAACTTATVTPKAAKKVLPPGLYDQCCTTADTPVVKVSAA